MPSTARATSHLIASLCVCLALPAARRQPSASFRGGPAHAGVYDGPAPTSIDRVRWRVRTEGLVIGSPAVANGVVYVGSTDGRLYALDAATGRQRWTFQTEARVPSSPAVADGLVYVASYDGAIYALDASTGRARWRFATRGERRYAATHLHGFAPTAERMPDPFDVYLSSPAVSNGVVYVGSGDGRVYALDARTGRVRWSVTTGDVVHASPAVANGTVYVGSWDGTFYALDAATGRTRWTFRTGADPEYHNQTGIQGSAAVVDGVVYFGCRDSHVYALDARTGALRWRFFNDSAWVVASPAVHDGAVYIGNADGRTLYELDARTGRPRFLRRGTWYWFASPAIAGGVLYAGNWDGTLEAIDLRTHRVLSTFRTEASRRNRAKYLKPDGTMNFRAARGPEYFYDELPGALKNLFTMGTFLSSPVIANGTLYIGSTDGYVYALGA